MYATIGVFRTPFREGKVQSVLLENTKTGEQSELATDGVFIYVGMDPLTESVRPLGITNDAGYVLTDEKMYTKVKGVFAAGDVREKMLRQVVTEV